MKKTNQWLATVLALVMVFAMMTCAVAEETTYSITINNSAEGHTYEAYQIFTGDLSGTTLSNIVWGSGISEAGQTALQNKYDTAENKSAAGVAEALTSDNAVQFAKDVAGYLTTTKVESTFASSQYTISGLAAGYYLVKDKDGSQANAHDAYTAFILKVVKDATAEPKTGVPVVQKKVKDTNDSVADSTTDWQDSADYDIGDTIPYQLTATMGDLSNFDHYYVEFVDTMTHLTYTGITSVKVGETMLDADQYTVSWNADTKTLNVTILDVKAYNATTGTKVVVEYTATLDDDAVLGSTGNPNEVYLVFTNNPNNTGDGNTKPSETGKTPTDKNIVFTYKVTANKTKSDGSKLAGAAFELFKKDATTGEYKTLGLVGATKNEDGTYTVAENTTSFSWTGIDDGDYKIVEVVTPAGYNTVADIEFTVTADHEVLADNPTLKSLSGGNLFTGEVSTGVLSTNIVNLAGSELPSTGGMGTTVLYVGGGLLALLAVVLLIAKRRSNA